MAIEEEDLEAIEGKKKKEPVKEETISEEPKEEQPAPEVETEETPEEPVTEEPAQDEAPAEEKAEPEPIPVGGMDLKKASEVAKKKLAEALGKPANATTSIERQGENWVAIVEILDEEYLPEQNLRSMNDILGVYEVTLSNDGELLKFERKSSYKRGEVK